LFDADYSGGGITMGGHTWTQEEIRSGASKQVCPNFNQYSKYTYTWSGGGGGRGFIEYWSYGATNLNVQIKAGYWMSPLASPTHISAFLRLIMNVPGAAAKDSVRFDGIYPGGWTNTTWTTRGLSVLPSPFPTTRLPTMNNYGIIDEQFGSTTVDGILYTWSRGLGW
jgi:hypothetical protein